MLLRLFILLTFVTIINCEIRDVLIEYRTQNEDGVVVGVDVKQPRISWSFSAQKFHVQQEKYQIIVLHLLEDVIVWDSGVVEAEQSLHILYDGKPLLSDTRYQVFVRVWVSGSDEWHMRDVMFHTGLMDGPFNGKWIGNVHTNMNQLRKEFMIPTTFSQATAYISGLGYSELYVNGQNVDPTRKLDPGWTTYETRVLYSTFDVSRLVKEGSNAIGVLLGNGWYSQDQSLPPALPRPSYGPPRLMFQLNVQLTNGTIIQVVSDTTWMGRQGSITYDGVYNGEHIDARLERSGWAEPGFTDKYSMWVNAEELPAPGGVLTAQMMEPIRTNQELKPVRVTATAQNALVFDFGQNFAGWVRLNTKGPVGTSISLRYAEIIENARQIYTNMIYMDNLRGAVQTDYYIHRGDPNGEVFEPRFTVHGFRYVQVMGAYHNPTVNDIVGVVVHSFAPEAGSFKSNNPVLNQIQHNIQWGQLSNLMSVPTDCNQRDERKGWMGDASLTVDEALYNFKLAPFYHNWAQNIRDTQGADGSVPDTVPFTYGSIPADPNWGTAYPTTVYAVYDHYADAVFVRDHYPNIKLWVDFLTAQVAKTGIGKMYYHYGDWVPPPPNPATSASLVSASAYAMDVKHLAELAGHLNMTSDQTKYQALYTQIGQDFHKAFYNQAVMGYAEGYQTSNVLALAIDAVPMELKDTVVKSLLNDITKHGNHLTTGIIGTRYLFPVLTALGQHDLALKIATQTTYPSYGYMFTNPYENATTLWEIWDAPEEGPGMNSRNHIMFGSIGAWFYRSVAGIKPNGLKVIEVSPGPVGPNSEVTEVKASYDTIKGLVSSHWRKTKEAYELHVLIPHHALGRIVVPHHDSKYTALYHDGSLLFEVDNHQVGESVSINNKGIQEITALEDGSIELNVLSGYYHLHARI